MRRIGIAIIIGALATLGLGGAAQASIGYPPQGSCVVDSVTAAPGGSVSFSCADDTFSASEPVTITVTGEDGSGASIGFIRTSISTISTDVTSTADGALAPTRITFPEKARGTYTIAAFSPSSAGGTATVSIHTESSDSSGGLPLTGSDPNQTLALWAIGGVLVAAGLTFGAAAIFRKKSEID